MSDARFDLPTIEDETRPWWDAANEGRLLIKRCRACGEAHYYPRPFCPQCWSEDVEWEDATGAATLYTYSTVFTNDLPPFPSQVPYVAAVVDLAEGPRMMTKLVDCEGVELAVGMPVRLTFVDLTAEQRLPVFRPA